MPVGGGEPQRGAALLGGIRRLIALADSAADPEQIFRALAEELLRAPGGEEVHVHHLAEDGEEREELVVVYLSDGEGRLSYTVPRAERAPGVSWVASTGRSFLAARPEELSASAPDPDRAARCALLLPPADRGEVHAVAIVRRLGGARRRCGRHARARS